MREERELPLILAHRGDMESAPENTLTALQGAVEKGADGVEIDIRMTRDGQIVLFHDENLSRVAPDTPEAVRTAGIGELTWDTLSGIELPFAGHLLGSFPEGGYQDERECFLPENLVGEGDCRMEKLLLFDDFLRWLMRQRQGFLAEIEFKALGMTEEALRLVESHGAEKRCIFFSGEKEINRDIQKWCRQNGKPESLRLGANLRFLTEETENEMKNYELWEAGLNAGAYKEEEIRRLEARGIRVFSNLGDTPKWWEQMTASDTAAFKTNCPGPYRAWRLKQYGI